MKVVLSSLLLQYYSFVVSFHCSAVVVVEAFEWSVGGRPEVTRQAIAGLWRLIPQPTYPLKEFTVHPKEPLTDNKRQRQQQQQTAATQELLLMLKEDGSFQQYMSEMEEVEDIMDEVDVNDAWNQYQLHQDKPLTKSRTVQKTQDKTTDDDDEEEEQNPLMTHQLIKGVWDFRDGKLILAADRPDDRHERMSDNWNKVRNEQPHQRKTPSASHLDKLIIGRVVATYESSLQDNPILSSASSPIADEPDNTQPDPSSIGDSSNSNKVAKTKENSVDGHLSVPKGSLKVGKFFYPKSHPSFFEQPIYNPVNTHRRFQLQQVLGTLNTATTPEDGKKPDTKFVPRDFYNKTFLLSAHPLRQSIAPPPSALERDEPWMPKKRKHGPEETINPLAESAHIRVMQVRFFPNNTFATVWGTGDAILRGKFETFLRNDNYAENKDGTTQLWMQVSLFGFGRGVSGSVYSEGRMLSHEDAKTYWGTISRVNITTTRTTSRTDNHDAVEESVLSSILEVQGSVLYGTGIGAEPVGRFLMREMMQEEIMGEEEDDEDDDDEEIDLSKASAALSSLLGNTTNYHNDDSLDDSILAETDDPNAFQ